MPKEGGGDAQLPTAVPAGENLRVTVGEVKVVSFHMPFLNLVGFFIKAAVAAIPAAIIVAIIYFVVFVGLVGARTYLHGE
jgi:hypothetical protein